MAAWAVAFGACILYDAAFPNADTKERRAWNQFAVLMLATAGQIAWRARGKQQ